MFVLCAACYLKLVASLSARGHISISQKALLWVLPPMAVYMYDESQISYNYWKVTATNKRVLQFLSKFA